MATASRANAVACRASPLASRASICRNRMLAGDVSSSVAESRSLARSVRSPLRTGGSTTCAGNSITTARIDHRSGAASRALGLTAVGATIIKPPLRWRNRASRRSLSNNSSWSHAAVQGPGSSSDPGESSRTASTQTSPFAAIAGSNSACTMEPNSFGVAGSKTWTARPLNLTRFSIRSRIVAATCGDWQKRNPSQDSAVHSTWRRSRCQCSSALGSNRPPSPTLWGVSISFETVLGRP